MLPPGADAGLPLAGGLGRGGDCAIAFSIQSRPFLKLAASWSPPPDVMEWNGRHKVRVDCNGLSGIQKMPFSYVIKAIPPPL
jgi:hypothetical protein